MFLALISYVGMATGFAILVFIIAAGLYYVAEFFEEHTALSKRLLVRLICTILILHVLLLLEGFPWWSTLFALFSNGVYLQTVRQFPYVSMTSPSLLLGCVCAIINHFLWFSYFGSDSKPPYSIRETMPGYTGQTQPPFREIASFIGLMVWLVPLLLIVTLSAGDNVLPVSHSHNVQKPKGLLKSTLDRFFKSNDLAAKNIY